MPTIAELVESLNQRITDLGLTSEDQHFWAIKQKQDWLVRGELAPYGTFWNAGGVGYVPIRGGRTNPDMIELIYADWLDYQMTGDPLYTDVELDTLQLGINYNATTAFEDTARILEIIDAYLKTGDESILTNQGYMITDVGDVEKIVKYTKKSGGWDWNDAWDTTWDWTGGGAGQWVNDRYDDTIGGWGQSLNEMFGGMFDWLGDWGPWILIAIVGIVLLWIFYKK